MWGGYGKRGRPAREEPPPGTRSGRRFPALFRPGVRSGERARQLGEHLPLPPRQGGEVARQLEQPPLPSRRPGGPVVAQLLEEVGRPDPERLRDRVEPAGADPVDALLVLVLLLVGAAGQLGHLLQAQAEPEPPLADPRPDVAVHVPRAGRADGRPGRPGARTPRPRRPPPPRGPRGGRPGCTDEV